MFIFDPKAHHISFLLAIILSSCSYNNIIPITTQQIDIIQNHWSSGDIAYKNPTFTFFPILPREINRKDAKIDVSIELNPLETKSWTYLPYYCEWIYSIPNMQEECAAYEKIYNDFLKKYFLSETMYNSLKKRVSFISEVRTSWSEIYMKYAVWIHSANPITEFFVTSWYAKDYTFSKWDFVKQSTNIWWFWENIEAITVPILSEDKHFIRTSDVTATSKSGNTYGQAIFENIPLSFESGTVVNISLIWEERDNLPLNSLVLRIPYMNNLKWWLLKFKSWNKSILNIKTGLNQVNEVDILYCNEDFCDIHFLSWTINDIQELQFQY